MKIFWRRSHQVHCICYILKVLDLDLNFFYLEVENALGEKFVSAEGLGLGFMAEEVVEEFVEGTDPAALAHDSASRTNITYSTFLPHVYIKIFLYGLILILNFIFLFDCYLDTSAIPNKTCYMLLLGCSSEVFTRLIRTKG